MSDPQIILQEALAEAQNNLSAPLIADERIVNDVTYISELENNRSGPRFLMACLLAKIHKPEIDIRKPYKPRRKQQERNASQAAIEKDTDSYGGRSYDEHYVADFVVQHRLPCNSTTAFLTPAYRTKGSIVLEPGIEITGRPLALYVTLVRLLNDVYEEQVTPEKLLRELIRQLILVRDKNAQRLEMLLDGLRKSEGDSPLSAEAIVTLLSQHLQLDRASRLPVLMVAAAYQAASKYLGERVLPLEAHNAADIQTRALGDVQITLTNEDQIVTVYEMKMKRVVLNDIDLAVVKIAQAPDKIDNYIFITTDTITQEVRDYAAEVYERTGGIELVVLDCIGFIRHFLHWFHRLRIEFLDAYQALVLSEPDSSVSQALKEAFLSMRRAIQQAK